MPIIYFGTDSSTLLTSMQETGADVIGLDWRIPLDDGWRVMDYEPAVQGNLDPVLLFADWKEVEARARMRFCEQANGRPGHIFNLGHGILPQTPVENVKNLAKFVQRTRSSEMRAKADAIRHEAAPCCCWRMAAPDKVEEIPEFLCAM